MFYTYDDGVIWHRDRPAELAIPPSTSFGVEADQFAERVGDPGVDGLEEMPHADLLDDSSRMPPAAHPIRPSSTGSWDLPPMPEVHGTELAAEEDADDQFGRPLDPSGEKRLAAFGVVRSVALDTSLTQIVGPSQQRVALLFSPPTTAGQSYTVTTEPGASLGAGLNLTTTTGSLRLTEEVFGDAVKRPWFAVASSAFSIGVLETIVDDT